MSADRTPDGLISVLICTRGRPDLVRRCLASLEALDDPCHEILIVDNEPEPGLLGLAGGKVSVVHEPRQGLAFARNRAIREARGEIVAFIDDDCEASREWLRLLREAFVEPEVSCATGRVVAATRARPAHRWFERLSSFDRGAVPRRFGGSPSDQAISPSTAGSLGTGCNMAFRKHVFDRIGGFDTALDTPTLIRGGGDLDIFARVLESGGLVTYVPGAVVRHYHRDSLLAVAKQLFGYGVGLGALSVKYLLERRADWPTVMRYQKEIASWLYAGRRRQGRGSRLIGYPLIALELIGDLIGPFAYLIMRRRNRQRGSP